MRMRTGLPGIGIVLLALFGGTSSAGDVPVLTISKSAPAFVVSGQNLTYTLTYGNTGSGNATGVVVSDSLPAGTTFVSGTGGGTLSLGSVIWNIGDLNAGVTAQTVSFTVAVTATAGTITERFRMNIGVRSGPSGAAMTVTRRSAAGTVQTLTKSYPPNFFEQISGAEFLAGSPFGPNDSITIQVTSGSAIVYGASADNTTQDPSIQFATKAP